MLSTIAAAGFLLGVAATPVAIFAWRAWRSRLSVVQCLLWGAAYALVKLLWRTRWEGELPIADGQGAVIVCNHRSSIDPFFLQTVTHRKIHWMVAREYCEHPALRWFLGTCEVIPVGRGGIDTAATKAAMRTVKRGGIVGMFPEGRINRTNDFMLPVRPGAALVAMRAGVPLVPCYIEGSPYRGSAASPLFMAAQVVVHFGRPIATRSSGQADFASGQHGSQESGDAGTHDAVELAEPADRQEALMRQCLAQIAELARRSNFEPQMAPRHWKPSADERVPAEAS